MGCLCSKGQVDDDEEDIEELLKCEPHTHHIPHLRARVMCVRVCVCVRGGRGGLSNSARFFGK
jgi:hypothetical protein